ncbi:hypothetical protein DM01DRAFT_1335259 [Hesseltinella vesiculosa]|uniref:Mediator of RNA polymerase II transcription subunit 9 n=1 Tax=Hesseltinella vesiculosa TaxID=101127 RepID=A0A1X2GIY3_9FUNG|nr:hypothetical protein DM01DRAFT_1335259 [Hesseltinella vesiculosa]
MDESSFLQDDFADYTVDLTGGEDITMMDASLLGTETHVLESAANAIPTADPIDGTSSQQPMIITDEADDPPKSSTLFDKNEFTFLPQLHSILQDIMKGSKADDIGKAVVQLNNKIDQARLILQDLPGLYYVQEEQEAILQQELDILAQKKQQLAAYTNLPAFTGNTKE